jgi:uncharacterized protein (DUF1015 family)
MDLIRPFRGLRPLPDKAADIAAPPYDVLTRTEARQAIVGNPLSFLHVSRAEVDLPDNIDAYAAVVYEQAKINLGKLSASGALVRDRSAAYYAYQLEAEGNVQTGLAFIASLQAYRDSRIKRHELTRPEKEADRVRHMKALGTQTGPAMLAYPSAPEIDRILAEITIEAPETAVVTVDNVRHSIWPVTELTLIDNLTHAFESLPALYIADGHHRTAAAERVAATHRSSESLPAESCAAGGFLAVAFPHHGMRILGYHRVVSDLGGMSGTRFLERVRERFDVFEVSGRARPTARGEIGLYLQGQWLLLRAHQTHTSVRDPVGSLDVDILSQQLLGPILSINDLRCDSRVEFVGGTGALDELERRVASGMAAAFVLHPTTIQDLIRVADRGDVMPPKSTWFEPKLADGLVSHVLDDH